MFTNFGIPDIERRKRKRNLLIGQPQGSLSESIDLKVRAESKVIPRNLTDVEAGIT